jgi:hypothetical protein
MILPGHAEVVRGPFRKPGSLCIRADHQPRIRVAGRLGSKGLRLAFHPRCKAKGEADQRDKGQEMAGGEAGKFHRWSLWHGRIGRDGKPGVAGGVFVISD